jgi:hypothetical protein
MARRLRHQASRITPTRLECSQARPTLGSRPTS